LKENRTVRERNRRMRAVAASQQIERRLPDVRRNVFGATRSPDRSSFFARDRRQTGFVPRPPIQGEGGQAFAAAVRDQGIEKGIGSGVVGLSCRTDQAQYRREYDEMRDVEPTGAFMQEPATGDLRRGDAVEFLPVHLHDDAVIEQSRAVEDPLERPLRCLAPPEQAANILLVGYVGLANDGLGAERRQYAAHGLRIRILFPAPADQEQMFDPVPGDQPLGYFDAERAESAGDQITALNIELDV